MHVSKDSMWQKILKIFLFFGWTKQGPRPEQQTRSRPYSLRSKAAITTSRVQPTLRARAECSNKKPKKRKRSSAQSSPSTRGFYLRELLFMEASRATLHPPITQHNPEAAPESRAEHSHSRAEHASPKPTSPPLHALIRPGIHSTARRRGDAKAIRLKASEASAEARRGRRHGGAAEHAEPGGRGGGDARRAAAPRRVGVEARRRGCRQARGPRRGARRRGGAHRVRHGGHVLPWLRRRRLPAPPRLRCPPRHRDARLVS